jgi:hypothetical protein
MNKDLTDGMSEADDTGAELWREMVKTTVQLDEASGRWRVVGCNDTILAEGFATGELATQWIKGSEDWYRRVGRQQESTRRARPSRG